MLCKGHQSVTSKNSPHQSTSSSLSMWLGSGLSLYGSASKQALTSPQLRVKAILNYFPPPKKSPGVKVSKGLQNELLPSLPKLPRVEDWGALWALFTQNEWTRRKTLEEMPTTDSAKMKHSWEQAWACGVEDPFPPIGSFPPRAYGVDVKKNLLGPIPQIPKAQTICKSTWHPAVVSKLCKSSGIKDWNVACLIEPKLPGSSC